MEETKLIACDIGFGEVKVVSESGRDWKFKSIATIYNSGSVLTGMNGKEPVKFEANDYMVGDDSEKYGGSLVTMADVDALLKYSPLFLMCVRKKIKFADNATIALGLP